MARNPLPIELILSLLKSGPPRIAECTAGLNPTQLNTAPAPGEWSANQVVAHLRACADMWGGYIARMLAEEHPTIRVINPRTWIKRTNYLQQPFDTNLQAFTEQRQELLTTLSTLSPEQWQRSATMTGAGKPLQRNVHSYAESIAIHERPHLKQIAHLTVRLVKGT